MSDDLINDASGRCDAYKKALEEAERDIEKYNEQMRPIQAAQNAAAVRANAARAALDLAKAEYIKAVNHKVYITRCRALANIQGTDAEVIAAAHHKHFNRLLFAKLDELGIKHTFVPLQYILDTNETRIFQRENKWANIRVSLDLDDLDDVLAWPGDFSIDTQLSEFDYLDIRAME